VTQNLKFLEYNAIEMYGELRTTLIRKSITPKKLTSFFISWWMQS